MGLNINNSEKQAIIDSLGFNHLITINDILDYGSLSGSKYFININGYELAINAVFMTDGKFIISYFDEHLVNKAGRDIQLNKLI